MRVLITGINGFVGTHLQRFLRRKSYDVYGIDRHFTYDKIFKADIRDKKRILNIIKKIKPAKVFHLAAVSTVEKSLKFPKLTEDVNVKGTQNILDACVASGINPKVLIVSSSEVYGNKKKFPIKEDSKLNPLNPYAETRIKQEKLALEYFNKYGINIVISRSFNHTGPGQSSSFVCSNFAKQIAEIQNGVKKPVIEVGNLDTVRDFLDVRDIIVAYNLALDKCRFGEVYNICSSKHYKIGDILNIILGMSKRHIKVRINKQEDRSHDIKITYGDNSKFCNETKWKPKIGIEKTLKDLIEFWRLNIKRNSRIK